MMAMSTGRLLPNTATKTIASAMPGNDMITSSTRMMPSLTQRCAVAAMAPIVPPTMRARAVAPTPIASDERAP